METQAIHAGILIVPSGSGQLADQLAVELDRLFAGETDLRNRLFRWDAANGWIEVTIDLGEDAHE